MLPFPEPMTHALSIPWTFYLKMLLCLLCLAAMF